MKSYIKIYDCPQQHNRHLEVVKYKPKYIYYVTKLLLNIDTIVNFNEKNRELMKYEILNFFEEFATQANDAEHIQIFIESCKTSISPKTRKKTKQLSLSKQ